jgi:hypothetical protein
MLFFIPASVETSLCFLAKDMIICIVIVLSIVAVFGLAGVECVLHSLLAASGVFLVLKPLPSITVWYVVGVLSIKKELCEMTR